MKGRIWVAVVAVFLAYCTSHNAATSKTPRESDKEDAVVVALSEMINRAVRPAGALTSLCVETHEAGLSPSSAAAIFEKVQTKHVHIVKCKFPDRAGTVTLGEIHSTHEAEFIIKVHYDCGPLCGISVDFVVLKQRGVWEVTNSTLTAVS